MIIRVAGEADVEAMARITRDALSFASSPDAYEWDTATEKDLHRRLRAYVHSGHGAHGLALVVEIEAELAGVVACRLEVDANGSSRTAFVEVLAVAGLHRGRGIGTQLVQELKRVLPSHGAQRLDVDVVGDNEAALRFWRRAGFHDVAIRMTADLSNSAPP